MTIRELIEELESYYDQDSEVVMMGRFTPKRVTISERSNRADIISDEGDIELELIFDEIDEAIGTLESVDIDDEVCSEKYIDSALTTLYCVRESLGDLI